MDDWVFGCDVCQDVCPWNRFSKPHHDKDLSGNKEMLGLAGEEWQEMTHEVFKKLFGSSAVMRTGYKGLKRNLDFIRKKTS
jgi:epoxyqueuosine reductase